jgi:rhodanese-related sulfurtransferase
VIESGVRALNADQFEKEMQGKDVLVLDVRKPQDFVNGFIPGSLFIGLDGQFAPWVGTVIENINTPILLVTPEGREEEAVMRLSRVGYDNCIGFLKGGIDVWKGSGKKTDDLLSISAEEFNSKFSKGGINVLDVRRPGEYEAQHVKDVPNQPLDFIESWKGKLDKNKEYHLHCAGGYRSVIAASVLKRAGYKNLIDVAGGFAAISKTNIPITTFACQSKK